MSEKILVTAALPYANGSIHIGHLVEYVQADIMVRFLRLIGEKVIFICASDTHGTPIEVNAAKLGLKPEVMVKRFNEEHKRDFARFFVDFDHYYTTHSRENKKLSEYFFNELKKKGYIYTKEIDVIYCESCKRTLPDRYVKGTCPHCATVDQYGDVCESCGIALKGNDLIDPKCSLCGNTPVLKKSSHYFFKLGSFEEKLRAWLKTSRSLQPEIINHIGQWLEKGLEDWCISRDGPYFGFKIPGEKDKYFYVWLDAPIGYISTTQHFTKEWEKYWKGGRIMHFIGKDIVYFHFLFWPAMLLGAGFALPEDIIVHGFLTINGKKMSKSRGTFFTAEDFLKLYNPEYLRFHYAGHLSKKIQDIDIDFEEFQAEINNVLIGNVANFCYRVLSFAEKNYGGRIDKIASGGAADAAVKKIEKKLLKVKKAYSEYDIKAALAEILSISDLGNSYFQKAEPWKNKEKAKGAVGLAANIVRVLSILLFPVLPKFCSGVQKQLGGRDLLWKDISFNRKVHVKGAKILFYKTEALPKDMLFPLDLRVGKILSVSDHPNADSLYVLEVDLGKEKRQLVAGLKRYYRKKELEGKKVVVCANLKPAKLRGVESKGMLLAADDKVDVAVIEAAKSEVGEAVEMHGYKNGSDMVTIEELLGLKMVVFDGKVIWKDTFLHTTTEDIRVRGIKDGAMVR